MRRLVRALRLSARRVESSTGLSAAQLLVLRELEEVPGASLSELATRTLTDRTSVRVLVDRLASDGLVERGRAALDRRRAAVRLSVVGKTLLKKAPQAPTTELLAEFGRLPDDDLRTLATALTRLTDAMGLGAEPPEMLFADGVDEGVANQRDRAAAAIPPRQDRDDGTAGAAHDQARGKEASRKRASSGGAAGSVRPDPRPGVPRGSTSVTRVHTNIRRKP